MNTVLLLGGRSFLGGHICRVLLSKGYKILLHSTSSGDFKNLWDVVPHAAIEPVICGFGDYDRLRKLAGRSEFVIHAAIPYSKQSLGQSGTMRRNMKDFDTTLDILFESNVRKSVFVSVSGTIERVVGGVADETCSMITKRPKSWGHLVHKVAYEAIVIRHIQNGLRAVIVNPSMCVGDFDTKPSTGEFFRFFAHVPFALMPDALLNIVDVEDVALGTVLALEKGKLGERYILSGTNTTMGALIQRVRKLAGKPMPQIIIRRRLAVLVAYCSEVLNLVARRSKPIIPLLGVELVEQGSQHLTCRKAEADLGFNPRNAWLAVDRSYRWYKDNNLL